MSVVTYPAAMTSLDTRSVTKLFAMAFNTGSNTSGGTRECVAWAALTNTIVTSRWDGWRYLIKNGYRANSVNWWTPIIRVTRLSFIKRTSHRSSLPDSLRNSFSQNPRIEKKGSTSGRSVGPHYLLMKITYLVDHSTNGVRKSWKTQPFLLIVPSC